MNTQRQFLLGIFFLTALSILAFYTLFLTDFTLFGKPEQEVVYFEGANGLREGDPVMVSGLRIGRVGELEFEVNAPPEKRIKATLNLKQPIELLEGTQITIQESTLLGGRQVQIFPGEPGGPPIQREADGALRGNVEKNPITALASVGDLFTDNRESIRSILANFDVIVADARNGVGPVGRLLRDEEMAQNLADAMADFRATTASARNLAADIEEGKGVLGQLINDGELAQTINDTVTSLKVIAADLEAGRGTVGRLMRDEKLAEEVDKAIRAFSAVGQRIEAGDGVLGKLLSDEAFADDFVAIVDNFKNVSEDVQALAARIRAGEGTVGKLLMDTELYDEVLTGVQLLTRSVEDYREAAPISAFTGTLFSAF